MLHTELLGQFMATLASCCKNISKNLLLHVGPQGNGIKIEDAATASGVKLNNEINTTSNITVMLQAAQGHEQVNVSMSLTGGGPLEVARDEFPKVQFSVGRVNASLIAEVGRR